LPLQNQLLDLLDDLLIEPECLDGLVHSASVLPAHASS
jgi:hypothetical protein